MSDLPNKEVHAAIKAAAVAAGCADPVHATAAAIEAFTKGEFADESQVDAWFDLQRIKKPKLWEAPDNGADGNASNRTKGEDNPWSASFKGTDKERDAAIAKYIGTFGTAAAGRMAHAAKTTVGRPLRAA